MPRNRGAFFLHLYMTQNRPIGIFDSGVGGTSIWREIHRLLPHEDTVYLADSRNAPYGEKSYGEILNLSRKNTKLLLAMGCKIIVVACNTATTNAIRELRNEYKVPFIGIEPAIKPAALQTNTHAIGVLATKGTLSSELFHRAVDHFGETKIIEQVGKGLVQLVEDGLADSPQAEVLLRQYLTPMVKENIDYLVLGCTHYPYLLPTIRKILPAHIAIIDSGEAVARHTQKTLTESGNLKLTGDGKCIFYTNGKLDVLQSLVGDFPVIYKDF